MLDYRKRRLFINTAEEGAGNPAGARYRGMYRAMILLGLDEEYEAFEDALRSFRVEWGIMMTVEVQVEKTGMTDFMELMREVDDETGYPGNNYGEITIYQLVGDDWMTVARRKWWGVALTDEVREEFENPEDIMDFGEFGYFEPWRIEQPLGFA